MQFEKIREYLKENTITIVLAVLLIGAASWGGSQYSKVVEYQRVMDNMYEMSYYELVDSMENIDVQISKLMVSSSPGESLEILSSISRKSDFATSALSKLPVSHPAVMDTMSYLNTLGDYCRALVKNAGDGLMLKQEDYVNFENLRTSCMTLRTSFNTTSYNYDIAPDDEWDYYQQVEQDIYDPFSFEESGGIDYPSIIYDGPFSDALIGQKAKGLAQQTCDREQAKQIAAQTLGVDVNEVEISSEGSKKIDGYSCSVKNGDTAFISSQGGNVIWSMKETGVYNEVLSYEDCVNSAKEYMATLGINDMVDTWSQMYDGQCVISFAYKQENCIVYPDLVKMKVNMEDGSILGCDALGYWMNHETRDISDETVSQDEAEATILGVVDVLETNLCYIPTGGGKEIFCWEFKCKFGEDDYLIYVNALNGVQERIYKVVETMDGSLVV